MLSISITKDEIPCMVQKGKTIPVYWQFPLSAIRSKNLAYYEPKLNDIRTKNLL